MAKYSNTQAAIDGVMSQQELDIELAVAELSSVIELVVPSTTAHYAVEDLRIAIRRYYNAPRIPTRDWATGNVDVSMRNGAGELAVPNV